MRSVLATGLLAALRDSKRHWDIDSLARECANKHHELVPSSAASSSKHDEASKEIQTLVACICKQLEPFAYEDKDHRIQEFEAQLANMAVQAKSVPACSALPVVEPVNMEPQSKRSRIVVKSDLS